MRTLKHRDKVDIFLTLLAGLPLLASGLFGLSYITSLMLSDYQHALWIAQAMSALLIWIGGYFCYYAWRKRRRILSDYDILYRHYPELADDWSRLSRQAQVGDEDLGLYCYKEANRRRGLPGAKGPRQSPPQGSPSPSLLPRPGWSEGNAGPRSADRRPRT